MHRPGTELATSRSLVRRPTTTLTKQPNPTQHCGNVSYSQGSNRAHIKSSKKCKKFCVRCGCCRDLFFERLPLADHLNQPGIARRPACSPSEYLATSHVVVTRTTTTATVTKSRQSATTTTASNHISTARDLGSPVRPSRPLMVSRSRAASMVASMPTIAFPQATYLQPVDFDQLWSDLQDQNQTWATGVSHFEAISPATTGAVAMATPTPAVTQPTVAPRATPVQVAVEQERPSSPDTTDAELEPEPIPQPTFTNQVRRRSAASQSRRDRSRSPLSAQPEPQVPARPSSSLRFRLDSPADYLYWVSSQLEVASGLGSQTQLLQFEALDQSLRSQIALDSGPLGAAADQPFHVLFRVLSPMFAIWHMTGQR